MSTPTIAAVINTLNEERNIEACIRSLGPIGTYVDEVLVCDNCSEDRTVEIARQCGARVVSHERGRCVTAAMRRFAYTQSDAEWIIALDADERPTPQLLESLRALAGAADTDVYRFAKLQYVFGGFVKYGGWFCEIFPHFFRRKYFLDHYRADLGECVHYDFASVADAPRRAIIPKEGGAYLIHYAYDDLKEFAARAFARYCPLEAEDRLRRGESWSVRGVIWAPIRSFLRQYLRLRGYKDGMRGFVLAILMAHYYSLIELNLWFLTAGKPRDPEKPQSQADPGGAGV